ncbi:MAG: hypothetical protein AB8G96_01855 [Phycisphaerales bacterium]
MPTIRRHLASAAAAAVVTLACSGVASAREEFVLLLRDGSVKAVSVLEMRDGMIIHDFAGRPESVPIADVLAAVQWRSGSRQSPMIRPILRRELGLLRMRDGQHFPGTVAREPSEDPDVLSWVHPQLGRQNLPIEDIASVLFRVAEAPGEIELSGGDRVVLRNGDRLDGFIMSIGAEVVVQQEDASGDVRDVNVPLRRVAGLRLVADAAEPGDRRMWFDEGTVLDIDDLTAPAASSISVSRPGSGTPITLEGIDLEDVAAIVFDMDALVPLAALPVERIEPLDGRYRAEAPQLLQPRVAAQLGAVTLTGPASVTWTLPEPNGRFLADVTIPEGARDWADLEFVVLDGREERMRVRLNRANPSAPIDVRMASSDRRLTIRLETGRHGAVQDRVELTLARVQYEG